MALDTDSVHVRLQKARGQIAAVDRMILAGESAESILVQINAAKAALHKVALMVAEDAVSSKAVDGESAEELCTVIRRFSSLL